MIIICSYNFIRLNCANNIVVMLLVVLLNIAHIDCFHNLNYFNLENWDLLIIGNLYIFHKNIFLRTIYTCYTPKSNWFDNFIQRLYLSYLLLINVNNCTSFQTFINILATVQYLRMFFMNIILYITIIIYISSTFLSNIMVLS